MDYFDAAHRVQTAIAYFISKNSDWALTQLKSLRTGIDLSKSDQQGLAELLISKGVFTREEYIEAVTSSAHAEADRYERAVNEALGTTNIVTR